jgi:CubicO group peptidase (beta-lactamase class C family)
MKDTMPRHNASSICLAAIFCLLSAALVAQKKPEPKPQPAQSIPELRQQLEKILNDTHTPGISVAIVHHDGPKRVDDWVAGLGKSNVAANQPATADTLFRIGSTSKAFVSLSILKLVNEGKLSLQDPVHKLAPEIYFENRWEATDPVRVVDLLEHTTGWDDLHLREYAKDAKGMTLREGLDYYHHSRISRWPPGTRMAYCNSGPPVAAYIVEKITGQRFEDYVTQNFFLPIGMKTATYFEQPSPELTTLYHDDGKTPYPYWNILERPAGAINASANDMAAYVEFYLNRGAVNGQPILPATDIDRMETPTRTWQAQQGLKAGYGLSNYTSIHDGFVYHGHNGGVEGGLTDMSYLPEYGVGYFYSTNAGNGEAFGKIGDAIRAYITRGLTKPAVPAAAPLPADAPQFAGWYEADSPRVEFMHGIERLGLHRVHFTGGNLVLTDTLGTTNDTFVPVRGEQFRYLSKKDAPEPIATAALISPNSAGQFVFIGGTWKRVPAWMAIAELVLIVWFLLALLAILLYAPFWLIGGLIKKRRRPAERAIRLWPLIAVLGLAASIGIFMLSASDLLNRLGHLTIWSFGFYLGTLIFAGASLASAGVLWLAREQPVRKGVRWFSIAVTGALLIVTAYFAYWGIIGIRLWA